MSNPVVIVNITNSEFIAEFSTIKIAEEACAKGKVELRPENTYIIATVHKCFRPEVSVTLVDTTSQVLNLDSKQTAKRTSKESVVIEDVKVVKEEPIKVEPPKVEKKREVIPAPVKNVVITPVVEVTPPVTEPPIPLDLPIEEVEEDTTQEETIGDTLDELEADLKSYNEKPVDLDIVF